jgi:predicted amidohydrolase YtcJ
MIFRIFVLCTMLVLLPGCQAPESDTADEVRAADIIFTGEHIITLDDSSPAVDAVAIAGREILATGNLEDVLRHKIASTRIVELGERALIPGFIDAHGHMPAVARRVEIIELASPPVGTVRNINDIIGLIKARIQAENIPPGTWISGAGYDDSLLAEGRHPNRDDLDEASSEHPIVVRHVSGHLLAVNSLALEMQEINADTDNPDGGVIRRRSGTQEPNGVMEETAMRLASRGRLAKTDDAHLEALIRQAIDLYASYGITTIQDGGAGMADIALMRAAANRQAFEVDVVAFPWSNGFDDEQMAAIVPEPDYSNGFRLGGVKFGLDGSPQGRTAFLSEPYTEGPPGASPDYRAYPTYPAEKFNPRIAEMIERGIPTLVHANGDGAIDMLIDGVSMVANERALPDHRTVIIHAQLMRPDQLQQAKTLGLIPSYYSAHPYFWGDWHRRSFGEDRAAYISPAADTARLDIPFTIHNDSPVVPPDMMRLLWIAVNRKTRSGFVLGAEQRLTPLQALQATTRTAAYQYFEENRKGSITPGKQADLVILGANPLLVDPDTLKDIPIIETFARGKSVYVGDTNQ